jgi:hypothetical protein
MSSSFLTWNGRPSAAGGQSKIAVHQNDERESRSDYRKYKKNL